MHGIQDQINAALWTIGTTNERSVLPQAESDLPPRNAAELIRVLVFNIVPRSVLLKNLFTATLGMNLKGESKVSPIQYSSQVEYIDRQTNSRHRPIAPRGMLKAKNLKANNIPG